MDWFSTNKTGLDRRRRDNANADGCAVTEGGTTMWTIRVAGEADALFDAMLRAIPEGYVVAVEHGLFTGDAEIVAVEARSLTVRPYDADTGQYGGAVELDWEGLDALEVY